jgi:hypothetical protein
MSEFFFITFIPGFFFYQVLELLQDVLFLACIIDLEKKSFLNFQDKLECFSLA